MSYLEKFIEAIEYRNELFKELFPNEKYLDIESYKSYSKPDAHIKNDLNNFKEISLDFLSDILYRSRINPTSNCHSISEHFKRYLHSNAKYNDNEISVTIGDVSFKNSKPLYGLNKEKLRDILKGGQKDYQPLDVHVWITYKSIYVFDPVIKFNLSYGRGLTPPPNHSMIEDCLLSWDENNKQELDYHPLLIDNNFFHKVDHF